ncbi:Hypothetical predicted protein [Mytilus galloprovincialis]|uniref:LRAT domain-containing protein n=1 Tax=Mytilus galloprovincialis TaxID=29158 RepID=A0A8B6DAN4_MYTGA|nr:Hypothetical predicted protein [Mytilus galloprovincialis]
MKSDVNHKKWVEGIPILSDINAMIQEYDRWKSPAKAFKWALHKTGVTCFGICAGHFAGLISIEAGIFGSMIGGIIGGLFVDAKISEVSLAPYGYCRSFEKLRSENMEKYDLTQLLLLAVKDGITGVKTLIAYNMFNLASQAICNKKLLFETNRNGLKDEMGKGNGKEIKCYSDACERFDVTTGKGYSYILKVLKLIIVGSGEVKKIPVDDISQLERGDHVVYERLMYGKFRLYDHHAIVEKLFPEKSKYRVYEQSSSSEPNKYGLRGKAWIKEIEKPFETKSLFKKDHEDSEISKENRRKTAHYICHHARPVEFEKTYNVLFNNCEHFVTVCSLRLHESQQVQEVIAGIIQCCIITILYFIGGKLTAMESSIDTDIDTTASDVHMYYKRFRDLRTRTGCFWD